MDLRGASCLVTGGSGGIGGAIAAELARRTRRLAVSGRHADRTREVAARTGALPIVADLRDPSEVERVAREAVEALGSIDVLVHAAGIGAAGPAEDLDGSTLEDLVAVNLRAPIHLTCLLLPGILGRRTGAIAFVASIAGHVGVPDEAAYAATKAGLIGFAESLRSEVGPRGVRVLVVSPGVVRTAFFERRGLPYGRRFPRPIGPRRVATAAVRALERDRPEVFVPRWLAVPARLHGAWPSRYRSLASRFGQSSRR